ncbi:MAG: ABC transporter permease [Thermoanaerobacter sp.]|nr:ABC transporter permease [Thermoanaerobacter sp.]
MIDILLAILNISFLQAIVNMSTPLLLAAIGDIYSERAGVLNIGLEGMMLVGAFSSFVISYHFNNPYIALIITIIIGFGLGIFHAFFTVTLKADQVITALGENILALGLTSTLYRIIIGVTEIQPECQGLPVLYIPAINRMPVVGDIMSGSTILVYIAFLMPIITYVIFEYTSFGLSIKAVGENPKAADSMGINVNVIRYIAVIISGIFAALGGASLTIGGLKYFFDNMTAGRGFIAFAAVIFGRYTPLGVFMGTLLFGSSDAFQLRLQTLGIQLPYHIFTSIPYIVTLLAMIFSRQTSFSPKALGKAYVRSS